MSNISPIELPNIVAIWRHSSDIRTGCRCFAALFHCESIQDYSGIWRFSFIKRPLKFIENGTLVSSNVDEWFGARSHNIYSILDKQIQTCIRYSGYKINLNDGRPSIPVVFLADKTKVLPSEFRKLGSHDNKRLRFKMRIGQLQYVK